MTFQQFYRQLVLYDLFPQPIVLYALRLARKMDDDKRQHFFDMLQEEYPKFQAHHAQVEAFEGKAERVLTQMSDALDQYEQNAA